MIWIIHTTCIQLRRGLPQNRCKRVRTKRRDVLVVRRLGQEFLPEFSDLRGTIVVELEERPQRQLRLHSARSNSDRTIVRVDVEFDELLDQRVIDLNSLELPSRNADAPNDFDRMLRVRLDRLLETKEGIVDYNCTSPGFLGLGPFAPRSIDVLLDSRVCVSEPFESDDYIDVASRLTGLQCRLDVVVGNKSARDELGRFCFVHRLDSHRFDHGFAEGVAADYQPFANGFRHNRWIYSFEAFNLDPDGTILVLNVVLDTNLALEVGLIVKHVFVLVQREDRLLALPHELFHVLHQFAETLANF